MSKVKREAKTEEDFAEQLAATLDECEKAGNVLLFLDEFHKFLRPKTGWDIAEDLLQLLSDNNVPRIAGVTESHYQKYFEQERTWQRLFHAVWIHDLGELAQP